MSLWLFQEFDDLLNEDRLTRVPTLVYANKQDLETAESRYNYLVRIFDSYLWLIFSAEVAQALQLHKLKDRAFQIQPCSAKTGEGVRDGLEWALGKIKSTPKKWSRFKNG